MKNLAHSYDWWPAIDGELEEMVQKCDTHQLHTKSPPAAPLHYWEWPEKPWTRIHIDYAGPFFGKTFLVAVGTVLVYYIQVDHELNNGDGNSL